MRKVSRTIELADLEGDETEGQFADRVAAEESGDYGDWGLGVVEYTCETCSSSVAVVRDNLANYDSLILGWHNKTKQGDYFSKFVFEYLAFIAFLRSRVALDCLDDRCAIRRLMDDERLKTAYLDKIKNDKNLQEVWTALIQELEQRPLHNSSRDYDDPQVEEWWGGMVRSVADWRNMIEYWCGIRNNLFHGGKDPNIRRDQFLVEHAFKTLNAFMKIAISRI